MRKYLLPETGNFYKANMHCHSTVSDGLYTPAELKRRYMEQGYSIIAYTDHGVMVSHMDLADENFLPLIGYEVAFAERESVNGNPLRKKSTHLNLITLDPDHVVHVCKNRQSPKPTSPMGPYLKDRKFLYEDEPDFFQYHTPECINEVIRRGRENGFFVTYNHPVWSLDDYNDYMNFHGMHAVEIINYSGQCGGHNDYCEHVYDDMLRGGERIFCVGGDDNHNTRPDRRDDSFGGFTVFKAEKLDYKTIADALLAGNFYASEGPEIYDLWYEDGKVHIDCSDADRIILHTDSRRAQMAHRKAGETLTSADFDVDPRDEYVRITVIDGAGKHADTNAYFIDELMK